MFPVFDGKNFLNVEEMTEKVRVLIVEDENKVAEDLRKILEGFGYEVAGVSNTGEEAIALAGEHKPDLVLMDLNLSGAMDGITAAGVIHTRWDIPIIYSTTFTTPTIIERAKKTTPAGYIVKPFNELHIQITIEMALYNARIEQHLKENSETIQLLLNVTDNPIILIDREGLIKGLNEAMGRKAGKLPEDLVGTPFVDLIPGDGISTRLADAVRQAVSGKRGRFEEENQGVVYEHVIIPVLSSHGAVESIAIYSSDITYLKSAEIKTKEAYEELMVEKNRLAILIAALDSMDDPVIITSQAGMITYVNRAFINRFRYTLPEVKGKNLSELAAPENHFALQVDVFVSDTKMIWNGNFIARSKYGMNLPFLIKSTPVSEFKQGIRRVFVLREILVRE